MSVHKGRAVRVEVALTFSAAKVVSAITKAFPGVATSTTHALAEGTIGYFSQVGGMVELEDQVGSVDATATNTFNIEGIDTTNFTTFSTSANFTPVATWGTLSTVTGYEISGGDADQLDTTALLDNQKQLDVGMLAAEVVKFDQFNDLQAASMAPSSPPRRAPGAMVIFRITLSNGERRIVRGFPTLPSESLSVNQVATGSFTVLAKKQLLRLPVA
jgi:hypothetical protein